MSIAALLQKCRDKGLSLDDAIEIVALAEEGFARPIPALDPVTERRRAYDRERQRVRRQSADNPPIVTAADPTHSSEENIPPSPPKGGSSPKGDAPPVRRNRGSRRAPASWTPSQATLTALEADGYGPGELERALAMVRDHEFRSPRTDWDATFRNWVRRDPPRRSHDRPRPPDQQSSGLAKLEAVGAAMAAAVERYRGVA